MAVHAPAYRPWEGRVLGRGARIWAIASQNIRVSIANPWILILMLLLLMGVGALTFVFFLAALLPQAVGLERVLPEYASNNVYRTYLTSAPIVLLFALVAASAGSGLISRDLRAQAIPLYLSRPITKGDYLAGKALALGIFLLGTTMGPAFLIWVGAAAVGVEEIGWGTRLLDLGGIVLNSLLVAVPMTAAVLALSSLTRKPALSGVYWMLIYLVAMSMGELLSAQLEEPAWSLLVWSSNLESISAGLYESRVSVGASGNLPAAGAALAAMLGITAAACAALWARLRRFEEA